MQRRFLPGYAASSPSLSREASTVAVTRTQLSSILDLVRVIVASSTSL